MGFLVPFERPLGLRLGPDFGAKMPQLGLQVGLDLAFNFDQIFGASWNRV